MPHAVPVRFAAPLLTFLAFGQIPLNAQPVVGRFQGSVEKGVYEVDYDAFLYAESIGVDAPLERVEGSIVSRVFVKPENKSNLEVFRSYERELSAAGFTTIVSATPARALQQFIWKIYRKPHMALGDRDYRDSEAKVLGGDLARLATFADYYLVGSRQTGEEALFVAIILSRDQNLYLVDEITTAAMETGTVSLNLDLIRTAMTQAGKIVVYDIHFATASAVIEAESAPALEAIASYLRETSGDFYVVGHTDDTGTLAGNVELSQRRAAAVKEALVGNHGIDAGRIETEGVGPLAPVSDNTNDAGRALNRRVEIVMRLGRAN